MESGTIGLRPVKLVGRAMPAVFTNAGLFTFKKLTDTQTLPTWS